MQKTLLIALRTTAVTLILTGIVYPYVVTGLAQLLFPHQANGSLVTDERGQVVGSELIGQGFSHPAYFQSRPSAAGANGYDATASSGSNLGPTSKKLQDRVTQDLERLKEGNPGAPGPVPVELVTTSASGLDPHLSPRAALWQVPRVASARGITPERVKTVVETMTEGRDLGVLGEPRVNLLLLNLALDRQFGRPTPVQTQDGKASTTESIINTQSSTSSGQSAAD
jgi:potassium-transporting ATPase KdpC subunit